MTDKRGISLFFTDGRAVRDDEETETIHVPSGWHGQDRERNDNPDTTTTGAGSPPGMMQKLVVAFPVEGKFAYWPQTTPDGLVIYRRDLQSKDGPERVGGPYVPGPGGYLWFDITSTMWRLWQASNQQVILGDAARPGLAQGIASAKLVAKRAAALEQINSTNARAWARG